MNAALAVPMGAALNLLLLLALSNIDRDDAHPIPHATITPVLAMHHAVTNSEVLAHIVDSLRRWLPRAWPTTSDPSR